MKIDYDVRTYNLTGLAYVQPGNILVMWRLDRVEGNHRQIEQLGKRKVHLVSLQKVPSSDKCRTDVFPWSKARFRV